MLNTNAFVVLAGNPGPWDEEMNKRCGAGSAPGTLKSEDLVQVQVDQHRRGRRSATLVSTIYGYSVRLASGLDERQVLFGGRALGRNVSKEEAIAFGIKWANEDPDKREFYVRKEDAS